jgi:hypothetical protein
MKVAVIFVCVVLALAAIWFADDFIAPLFLDSYIERLGEKNLPKILIEGGTVYCRMKADDFRFPLPSGSHALPPIVKEGGFDWLDGVVEARFDGTNQMSAIEYQNWLSARLQAGASVTVTSVPGGLSIKFHYFGDK